MEHFGQKEWPLQKPARPSTALILHPMLVPIGIMLKSWGLPVDFDPLSCLCHYQNPGQMWLLSADSWISASRGISGPRAPEFPSVPPRRKEKPSILQGPHATCIGHPSETDLNQENDTSSRSGHAGPRSPKVGWCRPSIGIQNWAYQLTAGCQRMGW